MGVAGMPSAIGSEMQEWKSEDGRARMEKREAGPRSARWSMGRGVAGERASGVTARLNAVGEGADNLVR